MRAVVVRQLGAPDVLRVEEVPTPAPSADQVLVQLHATGINFSETERRRGVYSPPQLPWIPGSEGAGVVVAVGSDAHQNWIGKRVAFWAMPPVVTGTYAEYAAVPVKALFQIPDSMEWATAAAIPLQGLTAYGVAHVATHVRAGQRVVVHAAAGGIGQWMIQMFRNQGAEVFGTTSSPAKLEVIRQTGVKGFLVERWVSHLMEVTHGQGADLIVDSVGKPLQQENLRALAPFGRLLYFGESGGSPDPISVHELYEKCLKISAYALDPNPYSEVWMKARSDLVRWVSDGKIRLHIFKSYRLDEAATAHRDMENRLIQGKAIILSS